MICRVEKCFAFVACTVLASLLVSVCLSALLPSRLVNAWLQEGSSPGEGSTRGESRPRLLAASPMDVVRRAWQRVEVHAVDAGFGPETQVTSNVAGVALKGIGFVSSERMWFDIRVDESVQVNEVPLFIESPVEGKTRRLAMSVSLSDRPIELALRFINFDAEAEVATELDAILCGLEFRGYGPFELAVLNLDTLEENKLNSSTRRDHLGVRLRFGPNLLEFQLRDALGRELREQVLVTSNKVPDGLVALLPDEVEVRPPVYWHKAPSKQVARSDCYLTNSLISCAGSGCRKTPGIAPPPSGDPQLSAELIVGAGVALHDGSFVQDKVVDLHVPGRGLDFNLTRSYRSSNEIDGLFGWGMDSSIAANVWGDERVDANTLLVSTGDGHLLRFSDRTPGEKPGEFEFLSRPEGSHDLFMKEVYGEFRYMRRNGLLRRFDRVFGVQKSVMDRNGNRQEFLSDRCGRITQIRDTLDRRFSLSYGQEGAEAGKLVRVESESDSRVFIDYEYAFVDDKAVLVEVSKYGESYEIYVYDEQGQMVAVVDARGIARVENEYDSRGRVVRQHMPGSEDVTHEFSYQGSIATHTSATGRTMTYELDDASRLPIRMEVNVGEGEERKTLRTLVARNCSCAAPSSITLPSGRFVAWLFDENGNVVERRQFSDMSERHRPNRDKDLRETASYAPNKIGSFGVMTRYRAPDGAETRVEYDSFGQPVRILHPPVGDATEPREEKCVYNSFGQKVSRKKPGEGVEHWEYYAEGPQRGRLKTYSVEISEGRVATERYRWDVHGHLIEETDALGNTTKYTLNVDGTVARIEGPAPHHYSTLFEYDELGHLDRILKENRIGTEPRDSKNPWWVEERVYDVSNRLVQTKREISESDEGIIFQVVSHRYDRDGLKTATVGPDGDTTLYFYDGFGRKEKIVRGANSDAEAFERIFYDADSRVIGTQRTFRNPGSDEDIVLRSLREYDEFGRLVAESSGDPDSPVKRLRHDKSGRVLEISVHRNSRDDAAVLERVLYDYDAAGNRTRVRRQIVDASGQSSEVVQKVEYDDAGRPISSVEDSGSETAIFYDGVGNNVGVSHAPDASGESSSSRASYDLNGSLVQEEYFEHNEVSGRIETKLIHHTTDTLGRALRTSLAGTEATGRPTVEVELYDSRGLPVRIRDENGLVTTFTYDGLGNKIRYGLESKSGVQTEVLTSYDRSGRVVSRRNADAAPTLYDYNARGLPVEVRHPDGTFARREFNGVDQIQRLAFGRDNKEVESAEFHRNGDGRVHRIVYFGEDGGQTSEDRFEFDALGRMTLAANDDTEIRRVFDRGGRMVSESMRVRIDGSWTEEATTKFEWDKDSLRSIGYPLSPIDVVQTYDGLDRLKTVGVRGVSTLPEGEGNDAKRTRTIAKIAWSGAGNRVVRIRRGSDLDAKDALWFQSSFAQDALGRPLSVDHFKQRGSEKPERLAAYLSRWGGRSGGQFFRRQSTSTLNAAEEQIPRSYDYDDFGRLARSSGKDSHRFESDSAQFLKRASKSWGDVRFEAREDDPTQVAAYTVDGKRFEAKYDHRGRMIQSGDDRYQFDVRGRLARIDGAESYQFVYDALGRRVMEKGPKGIRVLFHAFGEVIEEGDASLRSVKWHVLGARPNERLLSARWEDGNIVDSRWPMIDEMGSVRLVVDESGHVVSEQSYSPFGEVKRSGEFYEFGFAGRPQLQNNLVDLRTRFYSPGLGRFLQRDSIGDFGDVANWGNGYAYVANDPINRVDPDGRIGIFISGFGSGWFGSIIGDGPKTTDIGLIDGPTPNVWSEIARIRNSVGKVVLGSYSRFNQKRYVRAVQQALRIDPCEPVVIVGHSMGAHRSVKVAEELGELGICVDLLVVIDFNAGPNTVGPRKRYIKGLRKEVLIPKPSFMSKPGNVQRAVHFHKEKFGAGLWHSKPEGFEEVAIPGVTHKSIDNLPALWQAVASLTESIGSVGCNCPASPMSSPPPFLWWSAIAKCREKL